jgi:fermentation-respiration switch protein FrsA (DUF1100 family)
MVFFENSLIYYPSRYPDGFWDTQAIASGSGCSIEDCFFTAEDGIALHAWWCRPPVGSSGFPNTAEMVLVWFHGNAGNISHRFDMMLRLAELPVQVFVVDYRGYGRSEGKPSEEGLYRDGRATWRYLTAERGVSQGKLILFGKSLGGAVASDLVTQVAPAGLIIQSSFTSVPDMAAHHFPFVPRFLVRTEMNSQAKLATASCPKLIIHSPQDEVVPFSLGQKLFESASEPKSFYEVAGARHNETYLVGGNAYFEALKDFIASCAPAPPA